MTQSSRFPLLSALYRRAEGLSRAAVLLGGAMTLASVLLICFDVLARKFLGFTTGGADEVSGYAFAISTTWALAFTILQRANVRVDVLYQMLPVRLCGVLDWLSLVAMAVFIGSLTWYGWDVMATSWAQQARANTPLATPRGLPQGLWVAGLIWMCVVLALMLVRASVALVTGDIEAVRELAGVRSAVEEASEEAAAGERIVAGERA